MGKEKPISFTAAMIKACREGRKTVTRRVIKNMPEKWHRGYTAFEHNPHGDEEFIIYGDCGTKTMYARYNVGDLLWTKESWGITRLEGIGGTLEYPNILYRADSSTRLVLNQPKVWEYCVPKENFKWRSSRFMPKWLARTWLEVVSVRPERLQDITEEDAIREGFKITGSDGRSHGHQWNEIFRPVWDSINAKRGYPWVSNPWVWRIEFKDKDNG